MECPLLRTTLHDWHVAQGARMVGFAGWDMPIQYTSIIEEHLATRRPPASLDISHMGRLRFEGPGAAVFLAELLTRRVADMELGQIRYSLVTNDQGGILDDVLVGYYRNAHGQPFYLVVVNAGNRQKIVDWVHSHLPPERAESAGTGNHLHRPQPALGHAGHPRAAQRGDLATPGRPRPALDALLSRRPGETLHPAARRQGGIISRTGYTGEDGFELSIGSDIALGVWQAIFELGTPLGLVPTGLGGRDTLRLEAGMPLYGHELSEQIDPFEAGLGFACHLSGYDFPGRDALCNSRKVRSARSGSAWNCPAAACPAKDIQFERRPSGGPCHQRHLLTHLATADRHGLCPARTVAARRDAGR